MSSTVEAEVDLDASALKVLQIFTLNLPELTSIDPDFIQSVELESGSFGTVGFVVLAHYTLDGKANVAKAEVESINIIDFSVTFNFLEGSDLLDEYKSFKVIIKVSPNILSGSVVHWTIQFEKLNDEISEPTSLLNAYVELSKKIDDFLDNLL